MPELLRSKTKEILPDFDKIIEDVPVQLNFPSEKNFDDAGRLLKETFQGIDIKDGDESKRNMQIKELLEDALKASDKNYDISTDYSKIVSYTDQIGVASKQSRLLQGERIYKVGLILKRYKKGAFTKWKMLVYGNPQHPDDMQATYKLFKSLGDNDKKLLLRIPVRATDTLAHREIILSKKIDLIRGYKGESSASFTSKIRMKYPVKRGRVLKEPNLFLSLHLPESIVNRFHEIHGEICEMRGDRKVLKGDIAEIALLDYFKKFERYKKNWDIRHPKS